jgi:hypothetical protein
VPIYHLHLKNISRRNGASAVAAAAYRAGETLQNDAEERLSKFGGRRSVSYAAIIAPANAPAWTADRARLWNTVERTEKRRDARLAKEIEVALPRELDAPQKRHLVEAFAHGLADFGLVVDVSIHDDGDNHNPHAHLMMTTRQLTAAGFGGKIRGIDSAEFLKKVRALWAQLTNAVLGQAGVRAMVDHRSLADQGIERPAGTHRGIDRAERQRKQEARTRAGRMIDEATRAIRAAMQRDPNVLREFPRLAARADWPPATREPPRDMNGDERAEHRQFWRAVDRRHYLEEQARTPERTQDEEIRPGLRDPRAEDIDRVAESVRRDTMPDLSSSALRQLAELQESVNAAWKARGVDTPNLIRTDELNAQLADFRKTLLEMRMRDIDAHERTRAEERLMPEPGPYREAVPAAERATAEERMIEDMRRTPTPEVARAEDAAERMIREMAAARRGETPARVPAPDRDLERAQKALERQWFRERDDPELDR